MKTPLGTILPVLPALLLSGCVSERPAPEAVEAEGTTLFVPVVLSTSGAGGSFFSSQMTLTNRGTTAATITYSYTAAAGGGSGTGTDTLAAGAQKTVADAIAYLRTRGVPIPESGNRYGTLRVTFAGLSSATAAAVTVRTTTPVPVGPSPTGRAGLAYTGIPTAQLLSDEALLCGLRLDAGDRTNVAVQNAGSAEQGDVRVRLTYFPGSGGTSASSVEKTLAPGAFQQWGLAEIAPAATSGWVKAERVSGSAPWYAYAVINDNANSDGSFVTPLVESSLLFRAGLTLPVVVETGTFSTEVVAANISSQTKQVTLAYVADAVTTADKTASATVTLAPGEQRIVPAYVQFLRDAGAAGIGAAGPTFVGSLTATVVGGDVSGLFLGARTSNPGGGGRYGLFYAARPFGTAVTTSEAWLYGLQQDSENRTNLAILSAGETDGSPITLLVELFDGASGAKVAAIQGDATTLGARAFKQISSVLSAYAPGVTNAYARVTRASGQNGFVAYAVVNDGGSPGQRSGDGAFVAMSVDTALSATFTGEWVNTTFGSGGPVTLVVTGDTYDQRYTGTATTGGNVHGGTAPPPQTYADVFTLKGGTFGAVSSFYGTATTTVTPDGKLSGTLTDVPSPTVSRTSFTGTISPPSMAAQTITLDATIYLRAGGTARCLTTLQRQP